MYKRNANNSEMKSSCFPKNNQTTLQKQRSTEKIMTKDRKGIIFRISDEDFFLQLINFLSLDSIRGSQGGREEAVNQVSVLYKVKVYNLNSVKLNIPEYP